MRGVVEFMNIYDREYNCRRLVTQLHQTQMYRIYNGSVRHGVVLLVIIVIDVVAVIVDVGLGKSLIILANLDSLPLGFCSAVVHIFQAGMIKCSISNAGDAGRDVYLGQ